MKVIPLDKISGDFKFLELLQREIEIMQQINQVNIVRMYGARKTSHNLYMFLEYCKDGDLKQFLKKQGKLGEDKALDLLIQIIRGFQELYSRNIIHRDIKPANILIQDNTVKITDFGFARRLSRNMEDLG